MQTSSTIDKIQFLSLPLMELFSALIRHVPEGVTLSDGAGHYAVLSHKMTEMTGYTLAEANAVDDFVRLLHPDEDSYRRVKEGLREAAVTGVTQDIETNLISRASEVRTVLVSISPLAHNNQTWLLSVYRDVTERQQIAEALHTTEEQYKSLLHQVPLGIYRTTPDGCIIQANPALAQILGYDDVDDMMNQCVLPAIYEDELQLEVQHARLREAQHMVPGPELTLPREQLSKTDGVVIQEVELETVDGRTIWVRDTGRAIFGDEGEIRYIDGILEDITERKAAETALQEFTRELQARNEELDAFSHTVAHDLKNPLNLIMGYAELLAYERDELSEEEIGASLVTIAQATKKMSSIIDELMVLAGVRRTSVELAPLDMAAILAEAEQRLAQLIEQHNAEIHTADTWPAALGYAPWVEEVWANYLSNAIKYGGRPPKIEVGAGALPPPFDIEDDDNPSIDDDQMIFWVRDNGEGLTPQERSQLFVPFERLSARQVTGYGLGLSIVRRIVNKLGGQVGVRSQKGEGSLFYFTLPLSSQDESAVEG